MTEEDPGYCKHLEDENIRLHSILEQRTTEIDELKAKLKKYEDKEHSVSSISGLAIQSHGVLSRYAEFQADNSMYTTITIGNATVKECHLEHLANLYAEHCARLNRRPLLYRIWGRIVSCLSTKKI